MNSFVEQVKNRLDIVDVISQYVPVQRKGRDYWACCPFHNEKTPSFQIRSDHQTYHCYGCGKYGTMFTFIMEENNVTYWEAVEILAKKAGLEMPENPYDPEEKKRRQDVEKIYNINKETALFYYNTLKSPDGLVARQYLQGRQITWQTVQHFGMGYSPDFGTLPAYLQKKGYDLSSLQMAGVVGISESGTPYDFFGQRLMIPIINGMGKVIGFTGRLLEKKPDFAKYKNTGTTLAFNKRKNLFGINIYKQYRQSSPKRMILVEGHMDVVSLYQAGIPYAVASMGTSLTEQQCREIKRNADIVFVSYDGDSAGQNATIRGLDLLKKQGIEVRVVCLTDNLDPDDYVRKFGREGYEKLLEEAIPLMDFKLRAVELRHTFDTYDGRVKYAKEALSVLSECDPVERNIYTDVVSKKSGIEKNILLGEIPDAPPTPTEEPKAEKKEEIALDGARFVLASMYYGMPYVKIADVNPNFFENAEHLKILEYLEDCGRNNRFPRGDMLFELASNEEAAAINESLESIKGDFRQEHYRACLRGLKIQYKNKEMSNILAELSSGTGNKDELKKRLAEISKITFD